MSGLLEDGLILPALVLALMGWLIPRALSHVFPEGVRPLMVLAFVATLILVLISALAFVALYIAQGAPVSELLAQGALSALLHFGQLGLLSALLWGPIMIVSVAALPRSWIKETW